MAEPDLRLQAPLIKRKTSVDDSSANGSIVGLPFEDSGEDDTSEKNTKWNEKNQPSGARKEGGFLIQTTLSPRRGEMTAADVTDAVALPVDIQSPSSVEPRQQHQPQNGKHSHTVHNDSTSSDDDDDSPIKMIETRDSPSPPPPPPLPPPPPDVIDYVLNHRNNSNNGTPTSSILKQSSTAVSQQSLGDRVQDLETKLATLSRILQRQQRLSIQASMNGSPGQPRGHSLMQYPLSDRPSNNQRRHDVDEALGYERSNNELSPNVVMMPSPPSLHQTRKGNIPYLESPAACDEESPARKSLQQRKRLSFHLLYGGQEENLNMADDEDFQQQQQQQQGGVAHATNDASDNANQQAINDAISDHHHHNNNNNNNNKERKHDGDNPSQPEPTHPLNSTSKEGHPVNSTIASVAAKLASEPLAAKENATPVKSSDAPTTDAARPTEVSIPSTIASKSAITPNKNITMTNNSEHTNSLDISGASNHSTTDDEGTARTSFTFLKPFSLSKDKRSKWLDHLNSFQESNHDVDVQMQEFIKVPGAVEKTLSFGFWICVDSFLYICTILPIRFVWSCILLSLHYGFRLRNKPAGNLQFHRRHMYQVVQVGIIFLVHTCILQPISIGKVYHWIRGQAMLKLYVLIAMVEVFDRLMCSLGQDCLDSMYWNTTRRPRSLRMLISVAVVIVYVTLHSLVLFIHVATLNVAMNSADEALLGLLIAGNFAEIKSTVFKKYNKPSLFKITAGDICERFKLALFLGLILLMNFCQGMDYRKMTGYMHMCIIVWLAELLSDWLKHAFITKFNFIPSSVYPEYGLLLAGDVTGIGHEGVNLDHSHAVVKRLGFAQMPLVCVMSRLVREALKYAWPQFSTSPKSVVGLAFLSCWMVLLALKTLLGAYLQHNSLAKLQSAPELSQTPLKPKQKQKQQ